MGIFQRLNQAFKNAKAEQEFGILDPEVTIKNAIQSLEISKANLLLSISANEAQQTQLKHRYKEVEAALTNWRERVELARQQGNDSLIKEAMLQQQVQVEIFANVKADQEKQYAHLQLLKQNLARIEDKIFSINYRKEMLIERAKLAQQNSTKHAFERMEEKILQMEARSQAVADLAGANLEEQFALLEAGSDVDEELNLMKEKIQGDMLVSYAPLSPSQTSSPNSTSNSVVDAELEDLKRQLDSL